MSSGTKLMGFDVFLSHNSKDKSAVRELKELLSANGLAVWLDEDELQPGIPWQQLLEVGVKTSRSVAVLVGKDGLGPWEDEEMQGALVLAVRDRRPVIPILLPGASAQPELPMFLGNRTWVDLRAGFSGDGVYKLIWGITGKKPERIEKPSQAAKGQTSEVMIAPTRLHHGAEKLFGREDELAALDQVWNDPSKKVLSIVAFGGIGKTSLVIEWMAQQAAKNWEGCEQVFDWSFFSQGTREQGGPSADTFIVAALKFFGDEAMAQSAASAWDKGARLATLVAERRTLLVLDGVEPLQYPPGPLAGELKDPALATLLKSLAQHNRGLCIVTTRESVTDLKPFQNTTAPEWPLDSLSEEAGSALLKSLLEPAKPKGRRQVKSSDAERREIVQAVKGHALTLQLLGGFIQGALGDVRKWREVNFTKADASVRGGYAFKTMSAYEKWLADGSEEGARQLAILKLLGLFDRPADASCLEALRGEPAIAGLTEPLAGLGGEDWNLAIASLEECGLVSRTAANQFGTQNSELETGLDAHPLIREYFAAQLTDKNPEAWRAAHRRLYEHLCETTEDKDEPTLEDLQPLYQAVAHGCQAGLQQETCDKVYGDRIYRGNENYAATKLGAFGAEMGAVACFFDAPWSRLSPSLSELNQAWLLAVSAYDLRALGRLMEALEPMRAGLQMRIQQENWTNAGITASSVSELELTLGKLTEAVASAEQSVVYADRDGDSFQRLGKRTTLADALHQVGRRAEAEGLFEEAETIQVERQPQYPLLYALQGFRYCDLLLAAAERFAWQIILELETRNSELETAAAACRAVFERVAQTLEWIELGNLNLLSIALEHLTLGRVAFCASIVESQNDRLPTSTSHIAAAVDGLHRAGARHYLPLGLLTRAWLRSLTCARTGPESAQTDLDEAWEIAERGPMRLFMADIHLYRARLFHDVTPYPWASPQEDLGAARQLIEQCGYWRRKEELDDAEAAAKKW
jgi:tetratricopeptide (TPR) repeat protein